MLKRFEDIQVVRSDLKLKSSTFMNNVDVDISDENK